MNLREIFNKLLAKGNNSKSVLFAEKIGETGEIRLAIDTDKNPILLIQEESFNETSFSSSNYKLNFLEIQFNQLCKINESPDSDSDIEIRFSTIKLVGGNSRMIDYFLRSLEGLIIQLNRDFTVITLKKELENLIQLFSRQKSIDPKIALGLWGELFFINHSDDISISLEAWHNKENNRFDFYYSNNKCIEVKTTIDNKRVHTFSSKQIENYKYLNVEIASIQTESSSNGTSLKELWDFINSKTDELELKDKLRTHISNTLKSDFQALYDYKFDFGLAKSSLKYFNTKAFPTLNEEIHHSIQKISLTIDLDLINS
tara:strand:- start:563 stop:1507 length:945 start_codon:yes stop_codon:yes gene_type:complete